MQTQFGWYITSFIFPLVTRILVVQEETDTTWSLLRRHGRVNSNAYW